MTKRAKITRLVFEVEDWATKTVCEFAARKESEQTIQLLQMQLAELQFLLSKYKPKARRHPV